MITIKDPSALKKQFLEANPFPYIVIDNFLEEDSL
jgi:hypothetical protein